MEKKTKHTPAPWRWEVSESTHNVQLCGGGGTPFDLIVMDFVRYGMNSASPRFNVEPQPDFNVMVRADALSQVVKGREHHASWFKEINHPDALLIAAAPDMLSFIQSIVEDYENGLIEDIEHVAIRAEQLIKKATGDE